MCDVGLKDPIFCAILLLRGLSQTAYRSAGCFLFFVFFSSCVSPTIAWLGNTDDYRQRVDFLSEALGHYFCSYELLL